MSKLNKKEKIDIDNLAGEWYEEEEIIRKLFLEHSLDFEPLLNPKQYKTYIKHLKLVIQYARKTN